MPNMFGALHVVFSHSDLPEDAVELKECFAIFDYEGSDTVTNLYDTFEEASDHIYDHGTRETMMCYASTFMSPEAGLFLRIGRYASFCQID